MKAILKDYRQSPRKVRLLADLVRGKKVADALATLRFVDKRAAGPFSKVIESAVANAKQAGADTSKLFIKSVAVDKGTVLKPTTSPVAVNADALHIWVSYVCHRLFHAQLN